MRAEVLFQTLRDRRRSILWWTLGLIGLVGLNLAFYPSVRGDPALSDYAKDLPESVRSLFAGGELDIASPAGYLNSQIFALTAPLVLLIFAIGAGAAFVAGDEERGILDFVLAHPVRRRTYVAQRFLALTVLVAVLTAILLATVAVGSGLVNLEIAFSRVAAASTSVALLALLFGTVALAASDQAGPRRRDRGRRCARRRGLAPRRPRQRRRPARRSSSTLALLPGTRPEPAARRRALGRLGGPGRRHHRRRRVRGVRPRAPRPPPIDAASFRLGAHGACDETLRPLHRGRAPPGSAARGREVLVVGSAGPTAAPRPADRVEGTDGDAAAHGHARPDA